jgi:hypothetical protein
MSFCFYIPTCITSNIGDEPVRSAIKSVRQHYPETHIYIIDDSDESINTSSILKDILDLNLYIINNIHKGSACASWYQHLMDSSYDFGIMIQDSTELRCKLPEFKTDDRVKFFWWFKTHFNWDQEPAPDAVKHKNPEIYNHSHEILKFIENIEYCAFKEKFKYYYNQRQLYLGCMGNMAIISREYMVQLNNTTKICSLIPYIKTRRDRMCMETIFGLAVYYDQDFNVDGNKIGINGGWPENIKSLSDTVHLSQYLVKHQYKR